MTIAIKLYEDAILVTDLVSSATDCRFELTQKGCGPCSLELKENWRQNLGVKRGQEIHIESPAGTLAWRGKIATAEKQLAAGKLLIKANGYIDVINTMAITTAQASTYTNQSPETIAQTIFNAVIKNQSDIQTFDTDISGITIDQFDTVAHQNIAEILNHLAWLAGGFFWGVDENLDLFFRDPGSFSETPQHTFTLGSDIRDLELIDSSNAIINDITIEGTGHTSRHQHTESIAQNGHRHTTIEVPGITTTAAAQQLANGIFATQAQPEPAYKITAQAPQTTIKPWQTKIAIKDPQRDATGKNIVVNNNISYNILSKSNSSDTLKILT